MAEVEISVVGENIRAKLGEGPHWDTETQKLFSVDCFGSSVHVLDVETGEVKIRRSRDLLCKMLGSVDLIFRVASHC